MKTDNAKTSFSPQISMTFPNQISKNFLALLKQRDDTLRQVDSIIIK